MKARIPRRLVLLVALAGAIATAAAVSVEEHQADPVVVDAVAAAPRGRQAAADDAPPLPEPVLLKRDAALPEPGDLFASTSWAPPPPPPAALPSRPMTEAPPAGPPPLPFVYLGQYRDAARAVVFLMQGDRVLPVQVGDVIEGRYRIDETAGDTIVITYLPLAVKQTLHMEPAG